MKFYKINSNPLEEVSLDKVQEGELYVNSNGTRVKFLKDGSWIIDKQSPLNDEEQLEDFINPKVALKAYWSLLRNTKM